MKTKKINNPKQKKLVNNFVNQVEFAKILNKSKQYVNKLKKEGRLIFKSNLIDVENSLQKIKETSDPSKQKIEHNIIDKQIRDNKEKISSKINNNLNLFEQYNEYTNLTFQEAREKNEQLKAILTHIQIDEEKRRLVPIEEVKKDAYLLGKNLKSSLLTIPEKISNQLAIETDVLKIRQLLIDSINDELINIINKLNDIKEK